MNYFQIHTKFQILLAVAVGVSTSFLMAPSNQFQSTFNSSFLIGNDRLLKPIVIPNLTESQRAFKVTEAPKSKNRIQPERQEELQIREKFTIQDSKTSENSLKFSSRYSKPDLDEEITKDVKEAAKKEEKVQEEKKEDENNETATEAQLLDDIYKLSERSDTHYSYPEDEKEEDAASHRYSGSNEPKDAEEVKESEVAPTTSELYSELWRPYPEGDFENYETSSPIADESGESEEDKEEVEERRSVEDYHDSGSKNYHSIQTPLSKIQFRDSHAFKDDFDSGKNRTRLIKPISRRPVSHNWPYSKAYLKENLNEIPDDEWKEVEDPKPRLSGLELAVQKDEAKFQQHLKKPYNYIEERNRNKQRQSELAKEEEKDHQSPLFKSLKNYKVDEDEPVPPIKFEKKQTQKLKTHEGVWPPNRKLNTYKPPLKSKSRQPQATKFNITRELTPNFQNHQFLGPVVFNHNIDHHRPKPTVKSPYKTTQPPRNLLLKELEEKEKQDHNLISQRIQKALPSTTGKLTTQSFNHLEESDEMYNAILANIQSVFGIRTQPLKSASSRKSTAVSLQELNLEENRSLTWSFPLPKPSPQGITSTTPSIATTPAKIP